MKIIITKFVPDTFCVRMLFRDPTAAIRSIPYSFIMEGNARLKGDAVVRRRIYFSFPFEFFFLFRSKQFVACV